MEFLSSAFFSSDLASVLASSATASASLASFSVSSDDTVAFQVTKHDGEQASVDLSVEVAAECMQAAVINGTQVSQRELDTLNEMSGAGVLSVTPGDLKANYTQKDADTLAQLE